MHSRNHLRDTIEDLEVTLAVIDVRIVDLLLEDVGRAETEDVTFVEVEAVVRSVEDDSLEDDCLEAVVGLDVARVGAFDEFRSCSILCCFLA